MTRWVVVDGRVGITLSRRKEIFSSSQITVIKQELDVLPFQNHCHSLRSIASSISPLTPLTVINENRRILVLAELLPQLKINRAVAAHNLFETKHIPASR